MKPTRERIEVLGLAFAMFFFAPAATAEAAVPRQKLIVYSCGRDFEPYNLTGQEVRNRLTALLKRAVVFHEVSLDVDRGEPEAERPSVEYLLSRLKSPRLTWSSPSPIPQHYLVCDTATNFSQPRPGLD